MFSIKGQKEQCKTIFPVDHLLKLMSDDIVESGFVKLMYDDIVESGFVNSYLPKSTGIWLLTLIEALECAILH